MGLVFMGENEKRRTGRSAGGERLVLLDADEHEVIALERNGFQIIRR